MLRQPANELFPGVTGGAEDSSIQFVHRMNREVSGEKETEDRFERDWLQGIEEGARSQNPGGAGFWWGEAPE
jgi:hypothetical protein